MSIQRYSDSGDAVPNPNGDLVSYAAYQTLQKQVDGLRTFARRTHDLCDKHIEARQTEVAEGVSWHGACGDCVVWTLRAEAAAAKGGSDE